MTRLDRKIYEDEHLEDFAVCMLKKFNIVSITFTSECQD